MVREERKKYWTISWRVKGWTTKILSLADTIKDPLEGSDREFKMRTVNTVSVYSELGFCQERKMRCERVKTVEGRCK